MRSGRRLGSALRATPTIANRHSATYDVTVTAGSTSLRATIGSPSDPAADLDLFVFNCTTGTCVLAGPDRGRRLRGVGHHRQPRRRRLAGRGRRLRGAGGATTYDYVDVFVNPAFGGVAVTDANALRPAGATWTVPGTVTANAAPAAAGCCSGDVQVRTDTNVLIGSGDVIVQSVTP